MPRVAAGGRLSTSHNRGGRIRTDETSRPQTGRSTRLSYTPTTERPHGMTVSTYEVALGDLFENLPFAVRLADHRADVERLPLRRPVIPRHRRVMEPAAAIRARSILQRAIPIRKLRVVSLLLCDPPPACAAMVVGIVCAPARSTDRLMDGATAVELSDVLQQAATAASLDHVASLDAATDGARPRDQSTSTTTRRRGPWTPTTRSSSMSDVADGPETRTMGRPSRADGASRSMSSGTVSTI